MHLFEEQTSLTNIAFFHVSPFLLVTLLALAIPIDAAPWIAYTFLTVLVAFTMIVFAKLLSYLFVVGAFWRATAAIRKWARTKGAIICTRVYRSMLSSWWGRFAFGLLAVHTVAMICVWVYFHLEPMTMLRSTWIFMQAVAEHLANWQLLAAAIRSWVHSLFVGRYADRSRIRTHTCEYTRAHAHAHAHAHTRTRRTHTSTRAPRTRNTSTQAHKHKEHRKITQSHS